MVIHRFKAPNWTADLAGGAIEAFTQVEVERLLRVNLPALWAEAAVVRRESRQLCEESAQLRATCLTIREASAGRRAAAEAASCLSVID